MLSPVWSCVQGGRGKKIEKSPIFYRAFSGREGAGLGARVDGGCPEAERKRGKPSGGKGQTAPQVKKVLTFATKTARPPP